MIFAAFLSLFSSLQVDPYTLPMFRAAELGAEGDTEDVDFIYMNSRSLETTIELMDDNGDVVGETTAVEIEVYIP